MTVTVHMTSEDKADGILQLTMECQWSIQTLYLVIQTVAYLILVIQPILQTIHSRPGRNSCMMLINEVVVMMNTMLLFILFIF